MDRGCAIYHPPPTPPDPRPCVFAYTRNRTAVHLAVGANDVKMVRALMRWRPELNRSLQDELESLDHRRDLFVQEITALLASTSTSRDEGVANCRSLREVERFGEWLSAERRRLVRVTEMRCEECWRKVMTARDDKGRTPLHWAASGVGPVVGAVALEIVY